MPQWSRLLTIIGLILTTFSAYAKDATVFDVRRPLSMKNDEVPPKDYYINAGSNDGLKENMLVTINRRQSLYDAYQNKSPGDLVVAVGQLRIIHVQNEISVARLEKLLSRDDLPGLDFEAIMVGDKVDLMSARMAPRKTAALEGASIELKLAPSVEVSPAPSGTNATPATPNPSNSKDFSSTAPPTTLTAGAPM